MILTQSAFPRTTAPADNSDVDIFEYVNIVNVMQESRLLGITRPARPVHVDLQGCPNIYSKATVYLLRDLC